MGAGDPTGQTWGERIDWFFRGAVTGRLCRPGVLVPWAAVLDVVDPDDPAGHLVLGPEG